MSEPESTYRGLMSVVAAILFMLCFSGTGLIALPVACTGLLLLCLYKSCTIKFGIFDIIIALLLLWEFMLGTFTEGRNNCIGYLTTQYIFTAYYFILRLTLTDCTSVRRFLQFLSVFIFAVAAVSLVSFGISRNQVYAAGFDSLYDFKHLYRPLGNLNNVWGTLMLVLSGMTAVALFGYGTKGKTFIFSLIPFALTIVCLLLSFSRGIYICLALYVLLLCENIFLSKGKVSVKILKCAGLVIFTISAAAIHGEDSLRTARLVETESQQRSLENRMDALEHTVQALRANPLMGKGTGNYSLAVNESVYENGSDSYTNLAPNIVSQLLLEKGIVGTVLWALVYIAMAVQLAVCRHNDKKMQIFIYLFLTVVLVREMSIGAALTDRRILGAVAVLLALFQNNVIQDRIRPARRVWKISYMITAAVFFCGLCLYYHIFRQDTRCYREYSAAVDDGDSVAALRSLAKARDNVAANVLASSANLALYKETGDRQFLDSAERHIVRAISLSPGDAQLAAFRASVLLYLHGKYTALAVLDSLTARFPANTTYRLLTAGILYGSGDKSASMPHLVRAVISSPSILESRNWRVFANYDPETAGTVIRAIRDSIKERPEDPVLLSRFGKLLYLTGNVGKAEEYLSAAAILLPNLKTPWVCLAKIRCGEYGADIRRHLTLWGYSEDGTPPAHDTDAGCKPDYSFYDMKSSQWYGWPLYSATDFGTCDPGIWDDAFKVEIEIN